MCGDLSYLSLSLLSISYLSRRRITLRSSAQSLGYSRGACGCAHPRRTEMRSTGSCVTTEQNGVIHKTKPRRTCITNTATTVSSGETVKRQGSDIARNTERGLRASAAHVCRLGDDGGTLCCDRFSLRKFGFKISRISPRGTACGNGWHTKGDARRRVRSLCQPGLLFTTGRGACCRTLLLEWMHLNRSLCISIARESVVPNATPRPWAD